MAKQFNKYSWQVGDPKEESLARELAGRLDIPSAGARFLVGRDILTTDAIEQFLGEGTPPHDPFQFANMREAVEIVRRVTDANKSILIHGDYDVDGICGTAILYSYLEGLTPDIYRFLPDRRKDGYGVATRAVDWAIEKKIGLMIAVDCGTSDGEAIARLQEAGTEVVICDHHEFPVDGEVHGTVLNPVHDKESYPFRGLCGTGVAFKLVQALEASGICGAQRADNLSDLVALATVGDMAPLTDENRFFVRQGLTAMNENAREGIRAIREVAKVKAPELRAWHLGFSLAPRLNAPGRIKNPKPSLEILCEQSASATHRLAEQLEVDNNHRRDLTEKVREEVFAMIRSQSEWQEAGGFVYSSEGWDEGVLGIAAARVVEEFGKPALLIAQTGDTAKGSGRSVPGVHLKHALDECKDHLARFGGHAQAVGFSIEPGRIDAFRDALSSHLKTATRELPNKPQLRIDGQLAVSEITMELVEFLDRCEPFGYGNKQPVWQIDDVGVLPQTRFVGKGHLKFLAADDRGHNIDAISFNWRERGIELTELHGRRVDLAVAIQKGFYQNREYPEVRIIDMKEHGSS